MTVRPLTDEELLHLRLAAQALDRPDGLSAAQLVRHLCGVQAQVISAAALALGARSSSLTAAAVDSARLDERSIVLSWAMRGTLHLVAAEDHGWIVPLTVEPGRVNARRRLWEEGVPADQADRALGLIEAMLEREGPLTRAEIGERLQGDGIRTAGQALPHLLWLAAAGGSVCSGPEMNGHRCFVLARDWLGERPTLGRHAALAELAVRFLAAHAPAAPEDLAFWSGLRLADANEAWKSISQRLVEVPTSGGPVWTLRPAARPAERELVRLLPAFDEYLMGWKDRRPIASTDHWKAVNRGGGWVHPVLVHNGMLVATWRADRRAKGVRIELGPFAPLTAAVRQGAEVEARHLAAFLGTSAELVPIRRR